jgi:hypothetical protein
MRAQTFGDKQREAQQRKKQEELWNRTHPKESEKSEESKPKAEKTNKPEKRSA